MEHFSWVLQNMLAIVSVLLDCSHTSNLEPLEMQKIAIIASHKTDLFSEVVIANVYIW